MRKHFLQLALLFSLALATAFFHAPLARAAITQPHFADGASNLISTTITVSSTSAGDLLAAYVFCSGCATMNVTSSDGSVFTQAGGYATTTYGVKNAVFYLPNVPAGITQVSVTQNSVNNGLEIFVAEYAGVATANPVDASSSLVQTSSTYSSGNITTTAADDLLFADAIDTNTASSMTPASIWTCLYSCSDQDPGAHGDRINILQLLDSGAIGTYAATGTINVSELVGARIVAFKKASGGGGGSPVGKVKISRGGVGKVKIKLGKIKIR